MSETTKKFGRVNDVAAALGIKRRRVYQLLEEGKISRPVNGLFDLHLAIGEYTANTDLARRETDRLARGKPPPPVELARTRPPAAKTITKPEPKVRRREDVPAGDADPLDYNSARTMKERYAALAKRAEYLSTIGKLVAIEDVERREFEVGRMLRDRLVGFPARLAHDLNAEARRKLELEVEQLLGELDARLADIVEGSHAWRPPAVSDADDLSGASR